jgi:hypothetical protein
MFAKRIFCFLQYIIIFSVVIHGIAIIQFKFGHHGKTQYFSDLSIPRTFNLSNI